MLKIKLLKRRLVIAVAAVSLVFATASLVRGQSSNIRIGVLTPGLSLEEVFAGLQQGLARLGYVSAKNITFIVEDTKGNSAELGPRATKLLSAKIDLIFAVSTSHAQAAKHATSTVPIVFAWVGDPIEAGLIESYRSAKNNLTGVAAIGDSLSGKRLEVLLQTAPKVRRLVVLVAANESVSISSFRSLEEAAKKLDVRLFRRDVMNEQEIKDVLEETTKGSVDAIFHVPSTLVRTHIELLIKKAKIDKIPLAVHEDALLNRGALVSYGPNPRLIGLQAATLLDKVLKGARPGEIRIETPDRLFLAINRTTAREIGLSIPHVILERADRLVE
jgi:putative ABC transport system substrate-binding protein